MVHGFQNIAPQQITLYNKKNLQQSKATRTKNGAE
jgi:hypothetical protein